MSIEKIGKAKIILSNPMGIHNYFAWPSIARLKNGRIAVAASGFRIAHICPFGKAVISFSDDGGESYTSPAPVIDTVLDDRDAGLCPFGKNGLIVTSFNNTTEFQRSNALTAFADETQSNKKKYIDAYLDLVPRDAEASQLGSTFKVSHDNGVTFGELHISPITSPHGPCELHDGTILWVGRVFSENDTFRKSGDVICSYVLDPETGDMKKIGQIDEVFADGEKVLSCEPHAAQLPDGKVLCHFRVQRNTAPRIYATYQSESSDGGRTWTKPRMITDILGGAPAHLMVHSSGAIISTIGHREPDPKYEIRAMVSYDNGKTWSGPFTVCDEYSYTPDMGYPETIELDDGSLLTVFYCHPEKNGPANILQQKWRITE